VFREGGQNSIIDSIKETLFLAKYSSSIALIYTITAISIIYKIIIISYYFNVSKCIPVDIICYYSSKYYMIIPKIINNINYYNSTMGDNHEYVVALKNSIFIDNIAVVLFVVVYVLLIISNKNISSKELEKALSNLQKNGYSLQERGKWRKENNRINELVILLFVLFLLYVEIFNGFNISNALLMNQYLFSPYLHISKLFVFRETISVFFIFILIHSSFLLRRCGREILNNV